MDSRIRRVIFDEEQHKYWFDSKELKGVTGAIGKKLGHVFPDTVLVQASIIYGQDVHHESEMWIKEGKEPSTQAGKWVVQQLKEFQVKYNVVKYEAELMVSDFVRTASKIDIVAHLADGKSVLFDIKTTSKFDREYCSLQLSTYAYLYEQNYGENVLGLFVLGTKSKRLFRIIYQGEDKVKSILEANKC